MKNKPYNYYKITEINDLNELIYYCAKKYNLSTAFQFNYDGKEVKFTYNDLYNNIKNIIKNISAFNENNQIIALIGNNSYEWIATYFSIVNSNNLVLPLDPNLDGLVLKNILIQTNVKYIFCSSIVYSKYIKYFNDKTVYILETDIRDVIYKTKDIYIGNYSYLKINKENVCSIIYTSGTTSQPKGVMLSHHNIVFDALSILKSLSFKGNTYLVLPLYHTYAFTANLICLMLIGKTIFINMDLKQFYNDLKKYKPQNLFLVPAFLSSLYNQIMISIENINQINKLALLIRLSNYLLKFKIDLRKLFFRRLRNIIGSNLNLIITGGAPIQEGYEKKFRELGIQVINGYGITECSPVVSVNRNHYFKDGSVGQILSGVDVKIIDGEILVKGPNVFANYINSMKQKSEVFSDGWFKTGDLGYIDKEKFLFITGRKNNLIVLENGKKVNPEELEQCFIQLDYVKEVMVYQNNNKIVAEVYLKNDDLDNYKKKLFCALEDINKSLPVYKNISNILIREDEFIKTSTQKIIRGEVNNNELFRN